MARFDRYVTDSAKTLVNLSNSILRHYGHATFHPSLPEFDHLFKGHRKIAVFLFDAMGEAILNAHSYLGRDFLKHGFASLYCVNPATTVASTTSFLTARFPVETGWIGWSQQFDNYGIPIDCFRGTSSIDKSKVEDFSMDKECPVTRLDSLLAEVGVKAKISYPYPLSEVGPKTYRDIEAQATDFFANGGEFLYSYYEEPDSSLHQRGVHSLKVGFIIRALSKTVERFAKNNPDVLVLVIADHGQIDVKTKDIAEVPEIRDALRKPISLDGRCRAFFVKEECKDAFPVLMKKHYPDFEVLSASEALDEHFFGCGDPHPRIKEFLGDFIAVAKGDSLLVDTSRKSNVHILKGHHAGITKEEKTILVCAYNK